MAQYTTAGGSDLARTYDIARSKMAARSADAPRRKIGESEEEWAERVRDWERMNIVERGIARLLSLGGD